MTVGRNETCPCGSGKKYKKCCIAAESAAAPTSLPSPRFRFEPGSYGGPGRQYMPSVICYEQTAPDKWREHFCLVNPTQCFDDENDACACTDADLAAAAELKSAGGSDVDFAMSLKDKGYMKVEDWRRAAS